MASPEAVRPKVQEGAPSTGTLLIRGSLLRVLTTASGIAVGVFLMPFLIHTLGDRQYGIWALAVSITAYYAVLDLGLARAAMRYLARAIALDDVAEGNSVTITSLALLAGMGVITLLSSIVIAWNVEWFISDPEEIWPFRYVVLVLAADAAFLLPSLVLNATLLAHYRFDVLSWANLASMAVRTVLLLSVVTQGYSIVAMAVVILCTNTVLRVALAGIVRRLLPSIALKPSLLHRRQARQLLLYGRDAFFAGCADRIRSNIGIIIIAAMVDVATVTHYGIAARIAQSFVDMLVQALGVVGPLFMRADPLGDRQRTRDTFLLTTRVSVLASVTTAGGIMLVGDRFIEIWIGQEYGDAYWPLVILTGSFAVWVMQWPSISVLYATAKHGFYACLSLGEAAANLSLSLLLVESYGMIGVSLGTAIPILISMILVLPRYACRMLHLDLVAYYREVGRAALYATLSQIPLFLLVRISGIASVSGILALCFAYYPPCWAILLRSVLPELDRRRLQTAFPALVRSWI